MEVLLIEPMRRCRVFPRGFYSSHISEELIYLTQGYISVQAMVDEEVIAVTNQRAAECKVLRTRKSIFER
jgi:hypothetical protein